MSSTQYFLLAQQGIPAGSTFYLSKPIIRLGSDSRNDVVFTFQDVGRFHIEIQWTNNGFQLIELNSSMITTVNGKLIAPFTGQLLASGDYIQLGNQVAFRYMVHHEVVINPPPSGYGQQPQVGYGQPNQPVMPPPVTHTSSVYLSNPTRIGCKYCLFTLNPADPNTTLQQFVRVGLDHYHSTCYEKLPSKPQTEVRPAQIQSPQPLKWVNRTPIVIE
ncbi:MAG: FHA domain-containing protein [Phototrophicales bacterium]|nr:FHA domain-containing protein [Phototrophicales bacterium]